MPDGGALKPLSQMIRSYAGVQFDFDVQPALKSAEVPWCQLGGDGASPARLGWNTWIRCNEFTNDVDDAVFSINL
jgi:type VI secretion system protein ImpH